MLILLPVAQFIISMTHMSRFYVTAAFCLWCIKTFWDLLTAVNSFFGDHLEKKILKKKQPQKRTSYNDQSWFIFSSRENKRRGPVGHWVHLHCALLGCLSDVGKNLFLFCLIHFYWGKIETKLQNSMPNKHRSTRNRALDSYTKKDSKINHRPTSEGRHLHNQPKIREMRE